MLWEKNMPPPSGPVTFEEVVLEKLRFTFADELSGLEIGGQVRSDARLSMQEVVDEIGQRFRFVMETQILGNRISEQTTPHPPIPLTWWDAVKDRFAPRWFRRRYPVQYHHLAKTVTHYHLCPHSMRVCPEPEHIRFLMDRR